MANKGGFDSLNPWTPQILVTNFKIGNIGICAFPFEITTVASWRLKNIRRRLKTKKGIDYVILATILQRIQWLYYN